MKRDARSDSARISGDDDSNDDKSDDGSFSAKAAAFASSSDRYPSDGPSGLRDPDASWAKTLLMMWLMVGKAKVLPMAVDSRQ